MTPEIALIITESRTVRENLSIMEELLKYGKIREADVFMEFARRAFNDLSIAFIREDERERLK